MAQFPLWQIADIGFKPMLGPLCPFAALLQMTRRQQLRHIQRLHFAAAISPTLRNAKTKITLRLTLGGFAMSAPTGLAEAFCNLIASPNCVSVVDGFFDPSPYFGKLSEIKAYLLDTASSSEIYLTHGISVFDASLEQSKREHLFSEGLRYEQTIEALFAPDISPLAGWWQAIDGAWPTGARRLEWEGHTLPFGLLRLWDVGKEALPHQDVLRREVVDLPIAKSFRRQFGINLYLCNGSGGDLEVWNDRISDEEWQKTGLMGSYGYSRAELGEPDLVFSPKAGDLSIVDTECVHAVSRISAGDRLTISGFIGYTSDLDPLVVWS